jgi:nucleoid-associated protein YgaU
MSRYSGRRKAINEEEIYEDILSRRGVNQIVQYTTPRFKKLTEEDKIRIRTEDYVWRAGDKFWRLAEQKYGDPTLWWVVAQFNNKPTEQHLQPGDVIKIPLELSIVLGVLT